MCICIIERGYILVQICFFSFFIFIFFFLYIRDVHFDLLLSSIHIYTYLTPKLCHSLLRIFQPGCLSFSKEFGHPFRECFFPQLRFLFALTRARMSFSFLTTSSMLLRSLRHISSRASTGKGSSIRTPTCKKALMFNSDIVFVFVSVCEQWIGVYTSSMQNREAALMKVAGTTIQ